MVFSFTVLNILRYSDKHYTRQTNEMHNFLNYLFYTSCVLTTLSFSYSILLILYKELSRCNFGSDNRLRTSLLDIYHPDP